MLGGQREPVKLRLLLEAAAILHPPRAASARRLVACAVAGLPDRATLAELESRRQAWLEGPPPADDGSALRRLVAEDLGPLLAAAPAVHDRLAAWSEPEAALVRAAAIQAAALAALGIEAPEPRLRLVDRIPPPYDHPSLAGVSIGASEERELGLAPGLVLASGRLAPLVSEATVGHLLVHAALESRSPERLGRGLEEGIAEVLGGFVAAAAAIGADAADAAFLARRRTASASAHRAAFLAQVNAAALLARRHGAAGLASLVRAGRDAVKQAEQALARGRLDDVALPPAAGDDGLSARLDRCLLAPGPLLAVRPLAFHLAPALAAARSVEGAARALGVPLAAAREAARELMERVFVLVLSGSGEVLVDDLALVLASGALRYEVPRAGGSEA